MWLRRYKQYDTYSSSTPLVIERSLSVVDCDWMSVEVRGGNRLVFQSQLTWFSITLDSFQVQNM